MRKERGIGVAAGGAPGGREGERPREEGYPGQGCDMRYVWEEEACVNGVLSPPASRREHRKYHMEGQRAREGMDSEGNDDNSFGQDPEGRDNRTWTRGESR
jgi:hypothetical protein